MHFSFSPTSSAIRICDVDKLRIGRPRGLALGLHLEGIRERVCGPLCGSVHHVLMGPFEGSGSSGFRMAAYGEIGRGEEDAELYRRAGYES